MAMNRFIFCAHSLRLRHQFQEKLAIAAFIALLAIAIARWVIMHIRRTAQPSAMCSALYARANKTDMQSVDEMQLLTPFPV